MIKPCHDAIQDDLVKHKRFDQSGYSKGVAKGCICELLDTFLRNPECMSMG